MTITSYATYNDVDNSMTLTVTSTGETHQDTLRLKVAMALIKVATWLMEGTSV